MRAIPVDPNRVRLISTGNFTAVTAWVELSDGSRRPDPNGRQDVDDNGQLLWRVEVIMPGDVDDDRDRTDVAEITIAGKDQPDPGAFGDLLHFEGLTMQPGYVNKRTGTLTAPRWTATGVRKQGAQHKPQQQAA